MASGLTLDAGALIAAEKDEREFWRTWKQAMARGSEVTLPAVVLAQVWRGNNPVVARVLKSCKIEQMDKVGAKGVGALLAKSRTSDVIDAAVVLGAIARGDTILTSDVGDIEHLRDAAGSKIRVLPV